MSLAARHLEANGIATVIIGSAMDVVTHCGVPRYLHTDLPLGNPCGVPYDRAMQQSILNQALDLFHDARQAETVVRPKVSWPEGDNWRDDYARVDDSNREILARRGAERRAQQAADKQAGKSRAAMIADQ